MAYPIRPMARPLKLVASSGRTLPERVADHFIAKIFTGALAAGERLPPDRELADQLGVDRTSLRMAMQRLAHLGLIKAVQGSGVRVLDYRRHAGLDLLAAVFQLPQVAIGGSFLLELLDDWIDMVPVVLGRAIARMSHEEARELDGILLRQAATLSAGGDLDRLAALEVELQDGLAHIVGNTMLLLLGNSNRPARAYLARAFFQTIDVGAHVEAHREVLRKALRDAGSASSMVPIEYRAYLEERTQLLRRQLSELPISPQLIDAPSAATKPRKVKSASKRRRA